jgi:hypothetical protein
MLNRLRLIERSGHLEGDALNERMPADILRFRQSRTC